MVATSELIPWARQTIQGTKVRQQIVCGDKVNPCQSIPPDYIRLAPDYFIQNKGYVLFFYVDVPV